MVSKMSAAMVLKSIVVINMSIGNMHNKTINLLSVLLISTIFEAFNQLARATFVQMFNLVIYLKEIGNSTFDLALVLIAASIKVGPGEPCKYSPVLLLSAYTKYGYINALRPTFKWLARLQHHERSRDLRYLLICD